MFKFYKINYKYFIERFIIIVFIIVLCIINLEIFVFLKIGGLLLRFCIVIIIFISEFVLFCICVLLY